MLGNLSDFDPAVNTVPLHMRDEIDRWAAWRAALLVQQVDRSYSEWSFHKVFTSLHHFCVVDMSSVYMDVIKDRLYVEGTDSQKRRAAQSTLYEILSGLVTVMAPILAFTSEELWRAMGRGDNSVHCAVWPADGVSRETISRTFDSRKQDTWTSMILPLREAIAKELECAREKGVIGSSLDAHVRVSTDNARWKEMLKAYASRLASYCIVSAFTCEETPVPRDAEKGANADVPVHIEVAKCEGVKCQRCWNYSRQISSDTPHPGVCPRCMSVVEQSSETQERELQ